MTSCVRIELQNRTEHTDNDWFAATEERKGMIDRLAIRARPAGWPLMHQTWDKLLFLHWPLPPESLRGLIPTRLALDGCVRNHPNRE
jgi:hypothetical protein